MASNLVASAVMRLIMDTVKQFVTVDNAVAALERYAAGKDGVKGTADDRLSADTLALLESLLKSGIAREIATLSAQTALGTKLGIVAGGGGCCSSASPTHN